MSTTTTTQTVTATEPTKPDLDTETLRTGHKEPLQLKGVIDQFQSFDVTPVIGREFVDVDLVAWLDAPNSDDLLRDLAITSKTTSLLTTRQKTLTHPQYPNAASSSSVAKQT